MKRLALLLLAATACRGKPAPVAATPAQPTVAAKPAPRTAPAPKSCGSERGVLRGDRVGALYLGMTPLEAREHCTVVRDTFEMAEGERERFLLVDTGLDTLRAYLSPAGTIRAIHLTSPRFFTSDSIHVGLPLARLLAFKDLFGDYGEQGFVVWSDAPSVCGLSFTLQFSRPGTVVRAPNAEGLRTYADSAKIRSIFARGCK